MGLAGAAAVLAAAPGAAAAGAPTPTARTADPTPTPAPDAQGSRATVAPRVVVTTPAPDFGTQKIRVGVQEKDGSYPAGADTSGSVVHIVVTDESGAVVRDTTCDTDAATRPANSTTTYCYFGDDTPTDDAPDPTNPGDTSYFLVLFPGQSATLTQTALGPKAEGVLRRDTSTTQVGTCLVGTRDYNLCGPSEEIFTDPGIPPKAVDDSATTPENTPVDIAILTNDDTVVGAPLIGLEVTEKPSHGTVAKVQATGDALRRNAATTPSGPPFTYTPATGFTGVDHFTYRLTDANGSATAVVTVTVTGSGTAPTEASSSGTDNLANTGTDDLDLLAVGALLIVGGAATTVFGRRVRSGRHAV